MKKFAVMALAVLMPLSAKAEDYESLEQIRQAASSFVAAGVAAEDGSVEVNAGRLDPRLKLAACDLPLEAYYPAEDRARGHFTVGVRCDGSSPWTIYVPVVVKLVKQVVVLSHASPRGAVLTEKDLRLEARDVYRLTTGFFTDPAEALGKTLTRSLGGGVPLNPLTVQAPIVVKRGQTVILLAQSRGFAVQMSGKALADGAAGQRIRVKNLRSERVIEGVVSEQGTVLVQN